MGRLFYLASAISTNPKGRIMTNTRAVTSQLTMRIVRALAMGPLRFNQIDRAIQAPNAPALSKNLKKMLRDGLIERHVARLGPPACVSYSLTTLGRDMAEPASALLGWVEANAPQIEAARAHQRALPNG